MKTNQDPTNMLKSFLKNIQGNRQKSWMNFFILDWPEEIWKSFMAYEISKEMLKDNFENDFWCIKDYSWYLWKNHSIKIDNKNQKNINIPEIWEVEEYWARQIINWIWKTPVGNLKILLIENIERMTRESANAFLKTFEETPNNVAIITTTSNVFKIIPTVLSRGTIIKFDSPDSKTAYDLLKNNYPKVSDESINFIVQFTWWKVELAKRILKKEESDNIDLNQIKKSFDDFINIIELNGKYHEKLSILEKIYKEWFFDLFLEFLWTHFSEKYNYSLVSEIVKTKQILNTNVAHDKVLFYFILKIEDLHVK